MKEIIVASFLIIGSIFVLLAAIGIVRFPDLFTRMHAATKASSFGVVLMLIAVAVYFGDAWIIFEVVLVISFIYLTAPVACHMIARAAYFLNIPMWEGTVVDELRDKYDLHKHSLKSSLENPLDSDGKNKEK
ncbi:MAG: monovalent cation/H(+) antiporter subunit G [Candidatus Anammoxibacter sp.]